MRIKNKDDFFYQEDHFNDHYTNLGFDFERNIMHKSLSQEMFANPMNDIPIRQLERLIEFMVNQVKRIKLEYNFTLPKNTKLIN